MDCLDVLRMVISPRSSHAFRVSVVWDDVAVLGEFVVANRASAVLFGDLSVQELPHLSG
jgi:hypothetical protein